MADELMAVVVVDGDRIETLTVADAIAPGLPPVWWVEVPEPSADPPAVNLVAFVDHGVPPGALLDADALAGALAGSEVRSADQLGAVRWYPGTGEVDQIYVQPAVRRQAVGTGLLRAAGTLAHLRSWPPLWGDGQRTALGERFRNGSRWRDRAAGLTVLLPPMTPHDDVPPAAGS